LDLRRTTIGLSRFPSEWIQWMRWTRYPCDVRAVLMGANRTHASLIPRYRFGTRGSQVQILSPRPIQMPDLLREFRSGLAFAVVDGQQQPSSKPGSKSSTPYAHSASSRISISSRKELRLEPNTRRARGLGSPLLRISRIAMARSAGCT